MKYTDNFTAIDFETMTAERSSACAVGLVKVIDGQIIQRFYSLINPIPDQRTHDNTDVHGITREMVRNAPTFRDIWPLVRDMIGSDMLVAHNADFDRCVWEELQKFYQLENPYSRSFFCTFRLTGLSLDEACAKHKIDMGNHHDALDDALACASVMLAENGHILANTFKGGIAGAMRDNKFKKYSHDTLKPIDDSQIENKNTPFYHARTVITGTLSEYPSRNELGKLLQSLGADINTTVSKRTDIVIIGEGAGPSKIAKIETLREQGYDIRIIFEPELISILENAKYGE